MVYAHGQYIMYPVKPAILKRIYCGMHVQCYMCFSLFVEVSILLP